MIDYKTKKCEIIEIGANEAKFLLNLNTNNRRKKNPRVAQYLFDFFNNPNFKNLLQGFLISFILYYVSFITYHSQKIYLSKIQKVKPFLKYL